LFLGQRSSVVERFQDRSEEVPLPGVADALEFLEVLLVVVDGFYSSLRLGGSELGEGLDDTVLSLR